MPSPRLSTSSAASVASSSSPAVFSNDRESPSPAKRSHRNRASLPQRLLERLVGRGVEDSVRKGVNGSDGDAEWARDGGGEGKRRRSMGESRLSATDVVDAAARGEREGVAENGLREGGEQQEEVAVERKCLKLRLITWNMHDELPSGDLSELLGEIQADAELSEDTDGFVQLQKDDGLYHIVVVAGQECPMSTGLFNGKIRDGSRSWTSILVDYLCESSGSITQEMSTTAPTSRRVSIDTSAKQTLSYQLVTKERLLPGIYIAVFALRKCERLVHGVSSGRVTAGLLNGRLGNKGAVAISLHFHTSRLLFICAHLAAHSSRVEERKANVVKIRDEMEIDDFRGDGVRSGKDLMNRFDQVFFLGDLNFRLDVSRLHAEWLLQSKDFQRALQFDQLRAVMAEKDSCFQGFKEADIGFAPTYKYDLLPRIKRKRANSNAKHVRAKLTRTTSYKPSDRTSTSSITDNDDDDRQSIISSHGSVSSAMSDYDYVSDRPSFSILDSPSRSAPLLSPSSPTTPPTLITATPVKSKSARVRFLTLVRANSNSPRIPLSTISPTPNAETFEGAALSSRPILRTSQSDVRTIGSKKSKKEKERSLGEEAIFDSSKKKRVQSYTDRILFRSNTGYGRESIEPVHSRNMSSIISDSFNGLRQSMRSSSVLRSDPPPTPPAELSQKHIGTRSVEDLSERRRAGHDDEDTSMERVVSRAHTVHTAVSRRGSMSLSIKSNPRFWRRRRSGLCSPPNSAPTHSDVASPEHRQLDDRPRIRTNSAPSTPIKLTSASLLPLPIPIPFPSPPHVSTTLGRLRSFFHIPFLSSVKYASAEVIPPKVTKTGPRFGEIEVIKYSAISDLGRMGAYSDHRPVFAEILIGVEEEE